MNTHNRVQAQCLKKTSRMGAAVGKLIYQPLSRYSSKSTFTGVANIGPDKTQ